MARRGESKSQKSISAEKARMIKRKKNVFTIRTGPGPHRKGFSVPLGFLVRDSLLVAQTMFEAKKILNEGGIVVNGVSRKEPHFGVGLFDLVGVSAGKKMYRVVFDKKGRLVLNEVGEKSPLEKVSKILYKKTVKKGLTQLTTEEGFVFLEKKTTLKPSDSIKISLPGKKILEPLEFRKGSIVYLIGGKKVGKTGKVTGITEGTKSKPKLVSIEIDGQQFQTVEKNIYVIGVEKPAMDLGKEHGF